MKQFSQGHALIIAIANYYKMNKLSDTVLKDARDMVSALGNPSFCGYPATHIDMLLDKEATAVQIRACLQKLTDRVGEEETAVIYFSGHGGRIEHGPLADNYLIPYDADPYNFRHTAISSQELTTRLANIQAKRLVVIFDCCHAAGLAETKTSLSPRLPSFKLGIDEALYDDLSQGNGRVIIASSRSDEVSYVLPHMSNSLFTHHLLQALRGEAARENDPFIRILDLFHTVSRELKTHPVVQHPVLKAELEDNFPIALAPQLEAETEPASSTLEIENPGQIPLQRHAGRILQKLFASYDRLILKKEFGRGWSGAQVFEVRPIKAQTGTLPMVVKVGATDLIQAEWAAFHEHIYGRVPKIATIQGKPVYEGTWGGICYPLAGGGVFQTLSLRELDQSIRVEATLINWVFPSLNKIWANHLHEVELPLRHSYDFWLPPNLVIDCSLTIAGSTLAIAPHIVQQRTCQQGERVQLSGFQVTHVNSQRGEIILNLPPNENNIVSHAHHLLLKAVPNIHHFQEGMLMPYPVDGIVTETRQSRIVQQANEAFNGRLDLSRDVVVLDEEGFANPIALLPKLLRKTADSYLAPIHGDLNLENVLVETSGQHDNIYLIDFCRARVDCVLHDFLCLETGLLVHVLPARLKEAKRPFATLHYFLWALRQTSQGTAVSPPTGLEDLFTLFLAIRKEAHRHLVHPTDWTAYDLGLTFYMLGILDFSSLDQEPERPLPKQVAFWTATITQNIHKTPTNQSGKNITSSSLSELMSQTRTLLQKCAIFETDHELRSFFAARPELSSYRKWLTQERRLTTRIDSTIAMLQKRTIGTPKQNGLVLFLYLLSQEYVEEDSNLATELQILAKQLAIALT